MCIRDRPVYLDVSFIFGMLPDARIVEMARRHGVERVVYGLSLIHISEPTRLLSISYAVFCLKKKKRMVKTLTVCIERRVAAGPNHRDKYNNRVEIQ